MLKKVLKIVVAIAVLLTAFVIFARRDGIAYTMASVLHSWNKPYFDVTKYAAEKNCNGGPACGSGPLRVLTFNIMCRVCGKQGYDSWEDRLPHVYDVIKRYDADLMGLQELAGVDDINLFLQQFPQYDMITYKFGKWSWADATLFYKKDRFEMLDSGQMWLGPKPDLPFSTSWRLAFPRYVNWAYMRQKSNGFCFLFVNTHFDNAGVNKEPSAKLYAKVFGNLAKTVPIIATGDYNTDSTTTRYKNLLAGVDGLAKIEDTVDLAPKKEVLNNVPDGTKMPEKMEEFVVIPKAIDHIFVAGPVKKEVTRWVMDALTYGSDYRRPSDHPSVFAEFNLTLRPQ